MYAAPCVYTCSGIPVRYMCMLGTRKCSIYLEKQPLLLEAAPVAKSEGCQPNHFGLGLRLGLGLGYGLGRM